MSPEAPKEDATEHDYLPESDLVRLAEAIRPQWPEPERAAHMKARVFENIRGIALVAPPLPEPSALYTLRLDERQWRQISRGVEMCTLREDEHSRSILLRMQPDSFLLPHRHEMSEESLILEGDALIGEDIHLTAGDYHFSPTGALHPLLQSPKGCVVFVRGEKKFRPRPTLGLFKRLLRGIKGTSRPGTTS